MSTGRSGRYPLSMAKNSVRIFTLSMLATHVDPAFLTGRLHKQGVVVSFSLSVILLWLIIIVLQEQKSASPSNLARVKAT